MDKNIDIKKILTTYLKQWKWFALSCILCIVYAYVSLRYTAPQYNAYAKIMLVDDNRVSNPAEEVLKDLGQISSTEKKNVEEGKIQYYKICL